MGWDLITDIGKYIGVDYGYYNVTDGKEYYEKMVPCNSVPEYVETFRSLDELQLKRLNQSLCPKDWSKQIVNSGFELAFNSKNFSAVRLMGYRCNPTIGDPDCKPEIMEWHMRHTFSLGYLSKTVDM